MVTLKNLGDIVEKINEEIPEKERRFILYGSGDHDGYTTSAYLFEKTFEEENLTFGQKVHKIFSPLGFHKKHNLALLELGEYMNIDYMTIQYLKILKPDYENLVETSEKIAKENNLKFMK